jgi:hypothetical protein
MLAYEMYSLDPQLESYTRCGSRTLRVGTLIPSIHNESPDASQKAKVNDKDVIEEQNAYPVSIMRLHAVRPLCI